jgi:hypothetical protein
LLQNPKKWIPDGLIQDKFGRIWMFSQWWRYRMYLVRTRQYVIHMPYSVMIKEQVNPRTIFTQVLSICATKLQLFTFIYWKTSTAARNRPTKIFLGCLWKSVHWVCYYSYLVICCKVKLSYFPHVFLSVVN